MEGRLLVQFLDVEARLGNVDLESCKSSSLNVSLYADMFCFQSDGCMYSGTATLSGVLDLNGNERLKREQRGQRWRGRARRSKEVHVR